MTGGIVSSNKFSGQGVQPLPAGSCGLLPLGTIIMPANDKLPPGSLVLPQGNLPGGQLRLALPSQLPVQPPLSHPPTQLGDLSEAAAPVDGGSAAFMTGPAPSGQEEVNACFSCHLTNSNDCVVVPDAAAAADQAVQTVSHSQYLQSSSEAAHTAAVMHARGQRGSACGTTPQPESTAGAGLETDAVSMTASEGTSMLGKLLLQAASVPAWQQCWVPAVVVRACYATNVVLSAVTVKMQLAVLFGI